MTDSGGQTVSRDLYDEAVRVSELRQASLAEKQHEVHDLRERLASKGEDLRNAQDQVNDLLAERDQLYRDLDKAVHLSEKRRTAAEELGEDKDRLTAQVEKLTAQVEEMELSPLDLAQQQRAKALTLAREVVEETGSSNLLVKGGSKVSLAGVVSTANYICTGYRDYVVAEGEFIERHTDSLPTIATRAGTVQTERDGGQSKDQWKSGRDAVIEWLNENLTPGEAIYTKDGILLPGQLTHEIQEDLEGDESVYIDAGYAYTESDDVDPVGPGGPAPHSDLDQPSRGDDDA